jgi:hypothetical protein
VSHALPTRAPPHAALCTLSQRPSSMSATRMPTSSPE